MTPARVLRLDREIRWPLMVAALLRCALMAAAYLCSGTAVMTQGDSASYLAPGRNLVLHGVFAVAGQPEIDRTPGYPIFMMLTGMVFDHVLLTVTIQILLSLGSLLLIRRIAELAAPGRNLGVRAAWLYAVEPLSILYTVRLMPETLFVLLLLFSIERLLSFQRTSRLRSLAAAGILLAAATYVRPVSSYLVFFLAAGFAVTARTSSLRWQAPAVLLGIVLPLLAAWQIRNAVETGYDGFSSIVEKNLYFFQSAEVSAELRHIPLALEQKRLGYPNDAAYFAVHPEQREWSRVQRLHFIREQAKQILAQHPVIYGRSHLKGVFLVAFSPCASEWLQMLDTYPAPESMPRRVLNEGIAHSVRRMLVAHPVVTLAMALFAAILLAYYAFALRGAMTLRGSGAAVLTLAGVALYFLLISGGAQAVGRYRLPVMPIVCVIAAAGLPTLRARKMRDRIGPASLSAIGD